MQFMKIKYYYKRTFISSLFILFQSTKYIFSKLKLKIIKDIYKFYIHTKICKWDFITNFFFKFEKNDLNKNFI